MKKIKDSIQLTPKEKELTLKKKDEVTHKEPQEETIKNDVSFDDNDFEDDENLFEENALELATMTRKERLAYKKALHKKRMASMEADEKRDYILRYYKWHFIGAFAFIFIAIWLGHTIYTTTLPLELMVAITNDGTNVIAENYIPDAFREYYDLDDKNIIQVFTDLTINNDDAESIHIQESTLTSYERVVVYITSDKLDVIIGDENAYNYYKSTGDIAIIDQCFDKEFYSQIESQIIMGSDETGYMNNGEPYAAAIDISGTEFVNNLELGYEQVYLMIPNNRYENNSNTKNLIQMIFKMEPSTYHSDQQ